MKDEGEKKERKKIARDSFCAMKFSQEDGAFVKKVEKKPVESIWLSIWGMLDIHLSRCMNKNGIFFFTGGGRMNTEALNRGFKQRSRRWDRPVIYVD